MTEKKRPSRTLDAGQGADKVPDPAEALRNLQDALRKILKVPKSAVQKDKH